MATPQRYKKDDVVPACSEKPKQSIKQSPEPETLELCIPCSGRVTTDNTIWKACDYKFGNQFCRDHYECQKIQQVNLHCNYFFLKYLQVYSGGRVTLDHGNQSSLQAVRYLSPTDCIQWTGMKAGINEWQGTWYIHWRESKLESSLYYSAAGRSWLTKYDGLDLFWHR